VPVCRISPHCLQIRRFGLVNCYLVSEGDGLTVVDTGLGAARIIIEAARQLEQPIRRIALTHAHMDHAGSVNALRKRLDNQKLRFLASEREVLLIQETNRGVKVKDLKLLEGEPREPVRGGFRKLDSEPNGKLCEGDMVGSLKVINSPGHTPGHIAFLDQRDGTLYAGDALETFGGVRLPFDPPWYFVFIKIATWHYPTALASGRKLAALEAKRVAPGHGPTLETTAAAWKTALERGENAIGSRSK
jgi:glyoxylase-like metal-dependent hydrolase (beta-lactamase superfamily II)